MRTGLAVGCRGKALGDCVKYVSGCLPGDWERVRFVMGYLGEKKQRWERIEEEQAWGR